MTLKPSEDPVIASLKKRLAAAFSGAVGSRLVALAAYGSSVDGSFIVDFSNFDLAIFLHGAFGVDDALQVQRGLGDLEPMPFGYLQTRFVDLTVAPRAELVPGSYSVFWGELPRDPRYLHDDGSLRQVSRRCL